MVNKKAEVVLTTLVILLVLFVVGLISNLAKIHQSNLITGQQTRAVAESRVNITAFLSIAPSDNLTLGIDFGDIEDLPVENINATENYNNTVSHEGSLDGNGSAYYITVSQDTNVDVDFCTSATQLNITLSGEEIFAGDGTVGNYSWSTTNSTLLANATSFNDPSDASASNVFNLYNYQDADQDVGRGNNTYYRFFLDIPGGQTPGTYNNTVFFRAHTLGVGGCPAGL